MNSLLVGTCYTDVKLKENKSDCKNFTAKCKFCLNKTVSGNVMSSTNFLNHIKEHHPQQFQLYEATKATSAHHRVSRKRRLDTSENDNSSEKNAKKQALDQPLIQLGLQRRMPTTNLTQSTFEEELIKMLVEDMEPISALERSGFRKFCSLFLPKYSLPSRRKASRQLQELYYAEKIKLTASLEAVRWVSATADIWSSHKRAFIGVTLHYVDPVTLKMVSSALACRRFKGKHTGIEIGKKLASIFKEFNILSKVQNVVTDNASNFVKAFNLYHLRVPDDTSNSTSINGVLDIDDSKPEGDLDTINISDSLNTINLTEDDETEDSDGFFLPPHKRCGNHSLNLVASVDAAKAREDKLYRRMYDRAMAKVQALWNAVSRSPKQNDVVDEIAGKTFIQPICTRWCSEYYAAERVVEIGLEKVISCQLALDQAKITEAEMKFLKSYLIAMKPVVTAMKLLEGDSDCYIGVLIPTIIGVQRKLENNTDPLMKPLVTALQNGLIERFGPAMESCEYRVASMLHPKFKLAFLPIEEKTQMKEILVSYVKNVQQELSREHGSANQLSTSQTNNDQSCDHDDLYSFLSHTEADSTIRDEVEGYLAGKSDAVSSLLAFPTVAEAFKKSNSTLPSSAAVERLFSAASQVLTNRRCRMADDMLDQLLFLRCIFKSQKDIAYNDI